LAAPEGLEPPTPSLGLKKNRLKNSDLNLLTSLASQVFAGC